MQKYWTKILFLLSISLASNAQASEYTFEDTTLDIELRKFSRIVNEFAFENMVDTPEGKFAFFTIVSIIQGQIISESWYGAEKRLKKFIPREEWKASKKNCRRTMHQQALVKYHTLFTSPIFFKNEKFSQIRREIYNKVKELLRDYEEIVSPIFRKLGPEIKAAASKAAANARNKGLTYEETIKAAFQAIELTLYIQLNKHLKTLLSIYYKGALSHLYKDLTTNPLQDEKTWNAMGNTYLKLIPLASSPYLNAWKIPLDYFVFRKQTLTFLLGYGEEKSTHSKLPVDVIRYILTSGY